MKILFLVTIITTIYSVNATTSAINDIPIPPVIIAECHEYANAHLRALKFQMQAINLNDASLLPENRNPLMLEALHRVYTSRTMIPAEILEKKMFRKCMALRIAMLDYSIYQSQKQPAKLL